MKRLLLLSLLGAFTLAGCVIFKDRPLSAGQSAGNFQGRSLNDAGLRKFLAEQRAGSGSWGVERLALAAAYFYGDVAIAQAQAQEAQAGIATAGERPNPVLSFSPGYNVTSVGISPWILTSSLDVPIETAGKRGKRIVQARAEAEAAQLRVAAAAWDARTRVRTAMLALYAGRENAALLKSEVALHEDALTKLDVQVKAGEAAAFELTQARLSLSRARLALHDAEKQAATGRAQLGAAAGVPSAALDAVTLDFSAFMSFPPVPGRSARRRALTHRSDLLAALADYAAADAALRLEIAKQYPDLHLSPGYEFDQGDNKWSVGLVLTLPILNQNRGPIAQAAARRVTAGTKFEARQAAVFGEIEVALAAYRAALAKATTAAKLAEEAAHASEQTQRIVQAGELAPTELIRRRIEASAIALSRQEARVQAQEAAGQLEAALQLPLRAVK